MTKPSGPHSGLGTRLRGDGQPPVGCERRSHDRQQILAPGHGQVDGRIRTEISPRKEPG